MNFPASCSGTDPGQSVHDIVVDISLEALENDPYPFYDWARRACPVAYVPATGRVLVMTWDLCRQAGANDRIFGPSAATHEAVYGKPNIMSMSGCAHQQIRTAVAAPLQPNAIAAYRETAIRDVVVRYIEAVRKKGAADIATAIAEPISARVVGDLIGFRDVDDATLRRWFRAYAANLVDHGRNPLVADEIGIVKAEVADHLARQADGASRAAGDSIVLRLLRYGVSAGTIRSVEEILPTVGVLIVGGFQEPAHAIANTLLGLFTDPCQAARVAADPRGRSAAAILEGLRWLPPFGMTEKRTTQDIVLGHVSILADTEIALVIGSANRDPARFERPDMFDLERPRQSTLAFGFGGHFCPGHGLARTLASIVLEEMFLRLPGLRPDPRGSAVVHGWLSRGVTSLPMVWD